MPAAANFSRTETDKLEEFVKGFGAKGLARAKVGEGGEWTQCRWPRTITPEARAAINAAVRGEGGRPLALPVRRGKLVNTVLADLRAAPRQEAGPRFPSTERATRRSPRLALPLGHDPPLFEYDEEKKHWVAAHHPFTAPHDESVQFLEIGPRQGALPPYDLVLNGNRDRRRLDPPPRPGGAGSASSRRWGSRRQDGGAEVRLPARRVQVRRAAARRHRAGHRPAGDVLLPAPSRCAT